MWAGLAAIGRKAATSLISAKGLKKIAHTETGIGKSDFSPLKNMSTVFANGSTGNEGLKSLQKAETTHFQKKKEESAKTESQAKEEESAQAAIDNTNKMTGAVKSAYEGLKKLAGSAEDFHRLLTTASPTMARNSALKEVRDFRRANTYGESTGKGRGQREEAEGALSDGLSKIDAAIENLTNTVLTPLIEAAAWAVDTGNTFLLPILEQINDALQFILEKIREWFGLAARAEPLPTPGEQFLFDISNNGLAKRHSSRQSSDFSPGRKTKNKGNARTGYKDRPHGVYG